jgi:hypothetical protein
MFRGLYVTQLSSDLTALSLLCVLVLYSTRVDLIFLHRLPRCLMNGVASAATFICYETALQWSVD